MFKKLFCCLVLFCFSSQVLSASIEDDINALKNETRRLQQKINSLQLKHRVIKRKRVVRRKKATKPKNYVVKNLSVHTLKNNPEVLSYNPAALMAGDYVLTYIAGMPVVTSPYLGARPAFDGSDLIVNISSINQDVRLMMQRAAVSRAFNKLGYPEPKMPLIALSGKVEPVASNNISFLRNRTWDLDLGSAELDVAAALNPWIEGYLSFAYDATPPPVGGQRLVNSVLRLNKSFVNIGNLNRGPFYATLGQLYVPFGRYSSSMISAPMTLVMSRTRARTAILGFKQVGDSAFYGAVYGFRSDTTLDGSGAGGLNIGYDFEGRHLRGEVGASLISSVNDAGGMQLTGGSGGLFTGFGFSAANELVKKIPAYDIHANINIDAVALIGEWVSVTGPFRTQDLSYNLQGARPQAGNVEAAYTFKVKSKPASVGVGYGWSHQALALGLPKQRIDAVFNISIWRDTVESIEYRHDIDYGVGTQAAGIGSTVATRGTGKSADAVSAQIGIYF